MWGYRSAEGSREPVVLFDYQPGRGQQYPQAILAGYRGLLMSDGYDAWRTLEGATHLGCMAHARRKFTDALKARKKPGGPPVLALKFFDALYEVERLARQSPSPEGETRNEYTLRLRQRHSVPVLTAFKTWLDELAPQVLPESLTGKAIAYDQSPKRLRANRTGRTNSENSVALLPPAHPSMVPRSRFFRQRQRGRRPDRPQPGIRARQRQLRSKHHLTHRMHRDNFWRRWRMQSAGPQSLLRHLHPIRARSAHGPQGRTDIGG